MAIRSVSFFSEGARVDGDLYLPDDLKPGERRPGIVLCNGFSAIRQIIVSDYARVFAQAGYPALAFDYRGWGTSEGEKWRIIPCEQIQDIRNALTWMEVQPEVDADKLGLWGTSNGGGLVIQATALDDRVKCVVSQLGYGNGAKPVTYSYSPDELRGFLELLRADRRKRVLTGKGEHGPPDVILNSAETRESRVEALAALPELYCEISWEAAEAMMEFRPIDSVGRLGPRPLLMLAAEHDSTCPPEDTKSVYDAAQMPKRWISYPIRHYDFYLPEWVERAGRDAVEWFDEHLRN